MGNTKLKTLSFIFQETKRKKIKFVFELQGVMEAADTIFFKIHTLEEIQDDE